MGVWPAARPRRRRVAAELSAAVTEAMAVPCDGRSSLRDRAEGRGGGCGSGLESVDFPDSNASQPLRPMAKAAWGELSRIGLAIQVITSCNGATLTRSSTRWTWVSA